MDAQGAAHLAVIAKRAYRFHGGRCLPWAGSPALCEEPRHEASQNPGAFERLAEDTDLFAPLKTSTDVLLVGSAHSLAGPVPLLDTGVVVGPLRKQVRAWGHRAIQLGTGGRIGFSDPEPFRSLPLLWDHAYGGCDPLVEQPVSSARRATHGAGAVTYPRNRAGRGFFLDLARERLHGSAAPRLEDPEDPVVPERLLARDFLDWMDRPVPACYSPVDWIWFPRSAWWLGTEASTPTRTLREVKQGVLSARDPLVRPVGALPDARAYNCAPPGLFGARLQGNERMTLWNVHPKSRVLEVDLPAERPLFLLQPPGCQVVEAPALLQTILLEPDLDRVTLTWTGSLEVAAPYPEEMCEQMERGVRWSR